MIIIFVLVNQNRSAIRSIDFIISKSNQIYTIQNQYDLKNPSQYINVIS